MKFIETRILTASKLYTLCNKYNWYTCGDNEEYGRLFDRLNDANGCPENMTTEKLVEIANDIWDHSEIHDYTFLTVLYELSSACFSTFRVDA